MINQQPTTNQAELTLVLGGTGKTGRRIVERLHDRARPVRIGSRAATPCFDWADQQTWRAALQGVTKVYISYFPDLAIPGTADRIRHFVDLAIQSGVKQLVLLSGRGEDEAQHCERIVQESGATWTILQASWFCQNFSEGAFRELVLSGEVALPAGAVQEPFVDADDIAAVAVAALTEDGHAGQLYELTGPRLLTFAEAIGEIAEVTGLPVRYREITIADFSAGLQAAGVGAAEIWLLEYLFTQVLDGRNAHLADGVQRALGRQPLDFRDFVRKAASARAW